MIPMADRKIDPHFDLPPNVLDVSYEEAVLPASTDADDDTTGASTNELVDDGTVVGVDPEPAPGDGGGEVSLLSPPTSMTVVDQITRTGTDGTTLADVVVEVDAAPGTAVFNIRIQKS